MTLQQKFFYSVASVIAVTILVVAGMEATKTANRIDNEIKFSIQKQTRHVLDVLDTTDNIMAARVQSSMKLLKKMGNELGQASQQGSVTVNGVSANNVILGNSAQGNNFELVDGLTEIMGGTATIFSKTGDEYIRIATNVIKNGNRAIGTKLSQTGKAIKKINKGEAYFGQVDILGSPYLTGYAPMFDANNNTIGIWYVGYSADMKGVTETIAESRILEEGFIALLDGKNNLRAHSDNMSSQAVQQVLDSGTSDIYELQFIEYPKWGYSIAIGVNNDEVSGITSSSVLVVVVSQVLAGIFILATVFFLMKKIVGSRIKAYIDSINKIASGNSDLGVRFEENHTDEFGEMAKGLNRLFEKVEGTIVDVQLTSNELINKTSSLMQIASSTQEAVQVLNMEVSNITSSASQLEEKASAVENNTNKANDAAKSADDETKISVDTLSKTIQDIQLQAANTESSVKVIEELAKSSEEISGVMDVIRNIAEQTNLLALNAAIEAARAGEQGRGFAVVADEVRSLASRTQSSTEEIRTMIEKLQSGSKEASSAMAANKTSALETVESTEKTGEVLNHALKAVDQIKSLNSATATMASQQREVSVGIKEGIDKVNAISNENQNSVLQMKEMCEEFSVLVNNMQNKLESYSVKTRS